ncbi:hypothetical protein RND81_03G002200 [Saponaria officinalis]|uniref:Uncharacterized protein n=1 Tax=Saponaria officinalis TaxID=3572 RepID=A0AAW1LXY5_SAPOF
MASWLQQFLEYIDDARTKLNHISPIMLLDQPYFWNFSEKFGFSHKIRNMIKVHDNWTALNCAIQRNGTFLSWQNHLVGVYVEIYNRPTIDKSIKPYKAYVDLVRFVEATYVHVNESHYAKVRGHKIFYPEDIERDLVLMFPNFYTNIFKDLYVAADQWKDVPRLLSEDLLKLSSVQKSETPSAMAKNARSSFT